ncbi:MAG TPA: insulinase family protein, partial [bacterium]
VQPEIDFQPRWNKPRNIIESYPIGTEESVDEKTYIVMNWLIGSGTDPVDIASFYILTNILLGNEAAPLKKAIIDSKLGQDLIYSGFSAVGLETVFSVGLKGAESDRTEAFVNLVLKTLTDIAKNEIDRERVDAAFQQAAYHYREILPSYPLHLMDRVLNAWIFGADPLTFVRMNDHLATCRQNYENDGKFFNKLIQDRILKNNHRLTFVLKPDREWQSRYDAAFAERMKKTRSQFTEDQLLAIANEAEQLEELSGTPNSPEALATLPQLQVSDLPRKPQHIPTIIEQLPGNVEFLTNDVFSNGVNYLYLNFDLKGLPADLWQFLPRYSDAIQKLGAAGMNYEQIAQRVAAYTGGIYCWQSFTTHASDPDRPVWGLKFSLKVLDEQVERAIDVMHDLIFAVDPRDKERLRDIVIQANAQYRTELVHDGSSTASRYAARGFSPEGYLYETVDGLHQLELTEKFNKQFDQLHADLMEKIEQVRDFILSPGRLTVSFTGSDRAKKIITGALATWIRNMPDKLIEDQPLGFAPFKAPPREGLAGPMQVAFCSQIIPALHFSHPDAMLLKLGARLISMEYMLNEIRFKGNAYGAWCRYEGLQRELELGSFRDPHIVRTLDVFNAVVDYVQQANWTQTDIDRAIIGTAKNYENPIRPKEAAKNALHRHLTGQTKEGREANFQQILSATVKDVRSTTLELLETNLKNSSICVVSSREKLKEANRQMTGKKLAIEDIL